MAEGVAGAPPSTSRGCAYSRAPRAGAEPEPLLRDRRAPRPAMGCLTLGTWRVAASASYLWDNLCAGCVLSTNIFFNIVWRGVFSAVF